MWNALFGGPVPAPAAPPVPEKTPAEKIKEQLKGWQANLRAQMRTVDRTVREGERSKEKLTAEVKMLISKNQLENAKLMVVQMLRMKKHIMRQQVAHATLNSLSLQLQQQGAMIAVTGTLKNSADILKIMNSALKDPDCKDTIRTLSDEMLRAGMLQEELSDGIDEALPQMDEESVDTEVNAVLYEISKGAVGVAPAVLEAKKQQEVAQRAQLMAMMEGGGGGGGGRG